MEKQINVKKEEHQISLKKNELKEILIKSWMTHDGAWFNHCLQECGIEKTNKINKAASRTLGMIEIKRLKKIFNINDIKTFNELKLLIEKVFEIVKADFMKFSHDVDTFNEFHCEMHQCFAYDGIKRIGVIDRYKCGIFDRIEGWFESLGIKYDVSPQIEGCMMHEKGTCFRNYRFYFNIKNNKT
ncbi:unnamed protein product [marine sediment metagenome]|uniref:L-2-amino-thiazoline-4-carboxylic acid hydrolase n=1 Tax=marine sediment metagenome TaxID=412755 RepID=X1CRL3_9ZZZZ